MNPGLASIDIEDDGAQLVIRIQGEVDLSNADALGEDIGRRITIGDPAGVVVDLTRVEYLDSRGVLLLMRLAARLRDAEIPMRVVAPRESVAGRLLTIAGFDDYFTDTSAA